jgi:hypothetical protein
MINMTTTQEMIGAASGLTTAAGSIPELQMATNPQHGYGLLNWNQVDQWGYLNNPIWNRVHKVAEAHGLDEVTKLRILADALMRQNVELSEKYKELHMRLPIPPFSIQSNTEASHGVRHERN